MAAGGPGATVLVNLFYRSVNLGQSIPLVGGNPEDS